MSKINLVLSASQQNNNCLDGDLEREHTFKIVKSIADILMRDNIINVFVIPQIQGGTDDSRLMEGIRLCNEFLSQNNDNGHGYNLEIHTDGGYAESGCMLCYLSERGLEFDTPIFNRLRNIVPEKTGAIVKRQDLAALKYATSSSALIELGFHDQKTDADWIHNNSEQIAQEIASGIYEGIGVLSSSSTSTQYSKEATVNKMIADCVTTPDNASYWERVFDGSEVATGNNVKTVIQRYQAKV